jgi:hypothetical protein
LPGNGAALSFGPLEARETNCLIRHKHTALG